MMSTIRVMSFNVRGASNDNNVNAWENRATSNVNTIKHHKPDVIGFQEVEPVQMETYQEQLSDYEYIQGPATGEEGDYGYNPIFWNLSRFKLLASGGFWLSKTPDYWSSDWDSACIRSATWVELRCVNTDIQFLHLNTHLDHISKRARMESSKLIISKLAQLCTKHQPLIITGDFNCNPGMPAYQNFIKNGFVDTYLAAGNKESDKSNTNHAFEGKNYLASGWHLDFWRIDWILMRDGAQGFYPTSCMIVHDAEPPVYPSDHYPVLAELAFLESNLKS